jgi:hypothetical protein
MVQDMEDYGQFIEIDIIDSVKRKVFMDWYQPKFKPLKLGKVSKKWRKNNLSNR